MPSAQHGGVRADVRPIRRRRPRQLLGGAGRVPAMGRALPGGGLRGHAHGRRPLVPRREAQRLRQLRGPLGGGGPRQDRDHLRGRRADGREARHLRGAPAAGLPGREPFQAPRRREGRPNHRVHADDPRGRLRHAGLREDRGRPLGGLRRLLREGPAGPHHRRQERDRRHRGRGPPGQEGHPAEEGLRRGHRGLRLRDHLPLLQAHGGRGAHEAGAGHLGQRGHGGDEALLPARGDGLRGLPLHALHLRLHGEAEGRGPLHRGLPPLDLPDGPHRLRPPRGRLLRLRGGHRLDHRALLHHLRAPGERRLHLHVRVRAHVPRRGPLLGHGAAAQDHAVLHGPDGDPHAHEVRRVLGEEVRPLQPPGPGLRRRAHQPGGLALVLRRRGGQALLHRGHLLADGDRRLHDDAHAGEPRDEARRLHPAHVRRGPQGPGPSDGQGARGQRRGRRPRLREVLALHAPHGLRGPPALPRDLPEALPRLLPHRRRLRPGQGRLLLDHGPRRRRHQRLRAPHRQRGDRARPRGPRRRRGVGRGRLPARGQGLGPLLLRDPEGGRRGHGGPEGGAQGRRAQGGRALRAAGPDPLHQRPPQDEEREDHAQDPPQDSGKRRDEPGRYVHSAGPEHCGRAEGESRGGLWLDGWPLQVAGEAGQLWLRYFLNPSTSWSSTGASDVVSFGRVVVSHQAASQRSGLLLYAVPGQALFPGNGM
mmetsp:Transcript_11431/g.32388  ORF Transcript_11431/g.32388 Transcript_11431/m.32388 type:complete len:705 (-) Transcript_11431:15-2129(-)